MKTVPLNIKHLKLLVQCWYSVGFGKIDMILMLHKVRRLRGDGVSQPRYYKIQENAQTETYQCECTVGKGGMVYANTFECDVI